MEHAHNLTRRDFVRASTLAGALFAGSQWILSAQESAGNTPSKGLAARDESGKLGPWSFGRRPLGDNDVLIDIKFCGICHSDIHQMREHWGPQQYPKSLATKSPALWRRSGRTSPASRWATRRVSAAWSTAALPARAAAMAKSTIATTAKPSSPTAHPTKVP